MATHHGSISDSWRCLLCSSLGLGFAHWYVQSPHIYCGGTVLYNYTGFFRCYYRYCNKHCPLQRNQASALCLTDLQKDLQSSAQQTQYLWLWLLLGSHPSLGEPSTFVPVRCMLQLWFSEISLLLLMECTGSILAEVKETAFQCCMWFKTQHPCACWQVWENSRGWGERGMVGELPSEQCMQSPDDLQHTL